MGNVNYKIVGNSDDAQRAVDKLRAQFEKLEASLKNQAKHSRQAKSAGDSYFQSQTQAAAKMVLGIVSIQSAWALAKKGIDEYMAANQRRQDLRGQVAGSARETEIKIINQGKLNKQETEQTLSNVNEQVSTIPVSDVTDAKRITEEAFSQGFDRQQVINGEILKAFLEVKAATNQFGAGATDSKELVKSLATSLRNTEGRDSTQAITADEVRNFGEAFQSLFLTQSIQLQDMIPFARIQSILSARGIDNKTQLAAFSVAVDAFGSGDVAATYLQQATAYMGRAGSKKMQSKLDKLGIEIDGTKFDLIGEDLVEGLRNLGEALNSLEPRQKADALDALFGTKAQAGALTLMGKADNIEASRKKIEDVSTAGMYRESVEAFQTSPHAISQRTAANAEMKSIEGLKSQGDMTMEDVQKILDATFEEIKKQNASSANLVIDKMQADAENFIRGNSQTPSEYLKSIQLKSNDRAAFKPGSDAVQTAEILNREIDKADPRTAQIEMLSNRLKAESKAAGVESSDMLPQVEIETVQNQAAKTKLWQEFDLKKQEIEKGIRKQQDESIYSYMGGLGGNPIKDFMYPETQTRDQVEEASKPLYEEYKAKADALDKPAAMQLEMKPVERPKKPEQKFTEAETLFMSAADDLGSGTTRKKRQRLDEAKTALEAETPEGIDKDEYQRNLFKRRAEGDPQQAGNNVPFPEKMEVSDPNAQASLGKMNATLDGILAVLSAGPDRQRTVKLPRTQGTA